MIVKCPSCGSNASVPTVRGFADLELAEPEKAVRATGSKGANTFVRLLSVLLLVVSVPCLAYGGYLYSIRASVSDPMDLTEEDLIDDVNLSMQQLPHPEFGMSGTKSRSMGSRKCLFLIIFFLNE